MKKIERLDILEELDNLKRIIEEKSIKIEGFEYDTLEFIQLIRDVIVAQKEMYFSLLHQREGKDVTTH